MLPELLDAVYFDEVCFTGHMKRGASGNDHLLAGRQMSSAAGGIHGKPDHVIHRLGWWNRQRDHTPTQGKKIEGGLIGSHGENRLLRAKA